MAIKNPTNYYEDIVYISANPYISNVNYHGFHGSKHFYKVIPCWDSDWNEKLKTVHPKDAVSATLKYNKKMNR